MFAIPSILMMCAASLVAPKNGDEQLWLVKLSNARITDTLKLSFKEDSISHFTVSESLAGEPNYHVQSQYAYSSASGMAWIATNLKCDSTKLANPSICRTLDSIPTAALSFTLLGDLPFDGQCSLPNNCREFSLQTNTTYQAISKRIDTSIVGGARVVSSEYKWIFSGSWINPVVSTYASAIFLGDSICQSAFYRYDQPETTECDTTVEPIYDTTGAHLCQKELTTPELVDTVLMAQRLDSQGGVAGIAASSRAIHASTSLVFHDMQAFQTWKDAQGGTSVSAIGVNGEKTTAQHGARQMFVRSQGRVYRVLILGD